MGCVGNSGDPMEQTCDTSQGVQSTPNYCNTSPVQDTNRQTAGKIIFVAAPCNGGDPFPDGQDPAYYSEGRQCRSQLARRCFYGPHALGDTGW